MNKIRKFLGSKLFIHGMVLLGLFAMLGVIKTGNLYILFGVALSFLGALCGAFIRVIEAIKSK